MFKRESPLQHKLSNLADGISMIVRTKNEKFIKFNV